MSKWTNPEEWARLCSGESCEICYPRYVGDPFEEDGLRAGVVTGPVYAPGEFSEFVAQVQAALEAPAPS